MMAKATSRVAPAPVAFTVAIPEELVPAITAAREAYNATLPPEIPDPDNPGKFLPNPRLIDSDDEYLERRAQAMVVSWGDQYGYTQRSVNKSTDEYLASLPAEMRDEMDAAIDGVLNDPTTVPLYDVPPA